MRYLDRAIIVRLYDRSCIEDVQFSTWDLGHQRLNPRKRALRRIGTVIAKEEARTRRVDKGKSGQAQKLR